MTKLILAAALSACALLPAQTPASAYGIKCDGKSIDTPGFIAAGAIANQWIVFPPGAVCPTAGFAIAGGRWEGFNTTLQHLPGAAGEPLVHIAYARGTQMSGFALDAAGVAGAQLVYIDNSPATRFEANTLLNSGVAQPALDGITTWMSGGSIERNTVMPSIAGTHVYLDAAASTGELVADNDLGGSAQNAVYLAGWQYSDAKTEVRGNRIHDVTAAAGSSGQYGNGIFVYWANKANVHDNFIANVQYSAVRVNQGRYNLVRGNQVDGCGEVAMYAEFGAEGNDFADNVISHCWAGISLTNATLRLLGLPNLAHGNTVSFATAYGVHLENDIAYGNIVNGTPWGVTVGYGGAGWANVAADNRCTGLPGFPLFACIAVDSLLSGSVNQIHGNTSVGAILPSDVIALDLADVPYVSGISQANPAVVTFSSVVNSTVAVGQTYALYGIAGMTAINGKVCVVNAVTALSMTCAGLDSRAFTPYSNPANGMGAWQPIYRLYSSGLTPAAAIPAAAVLRDQIVPRAWWGAMGNGSSVWAPDAGCATAGTAGAGVKRVNNAFVCN